MENYEIVDVDNVDSFSNGKLYELAKNKSIRVNRRDLKNLYHSLLSVNSSARITQFKCEKNTVCLHCF